MILDYFLFFIFIYKILNLYEVERRSKVLVFCSCLFDRYTFDICRDIFARTDARTTFYLRLSRQHGLSTIRLSSDGSKKMTAHAFPSCEVDTFGQFDRTFRMMK